MDFVWKNSYHIGLGLVPKKLRLPAGQDWEESSS